MEIFGCHVPGFFRLQCYAELFQIQGSKAFHLKFIRRHEAHGNGFSFRWFWTLWQWCYYLSRLRRFRKVKGHIFPSIDGVEVVIYATPFP